MAEQVLADRDNPEFKISLPKEIEEACFDVILIDAPPGYSYDLPGRVEASLWSVNHARRCAQETGRAVSIFLHDIHRHAEGLIIQNLFEEHERIGTMSGPAAQLAGFRISPWSDLDDTNQQP